MKRLIYIGLSLLLFEQAVAQSVVTTSGNVRLNSSSGTRLVIQGGISFTGTTNFIDNGRVDLLTNPLGPASNWNDATVAGAYDGTSTGHVFFSAAALQTITGPTRFYDLTMDGTTGISLASDIEVRDNLFLNGGMFTTGANKVYVSNGATNAIQSSNSFASFINGILERFTNVAGSDYLFPIGKVVSTVNFYAPVRFNKINANSTRYTGEYFRAAPIDRTNIQSPPIDYISHVEYWELTSTATAGSTDDDAALTLSWRNGSGVSTNPADWNDLMIAHYRNNSGFRWEPEFNTAGANIVSGTPSFGIITSNITVGSFTNADRRFTLSTRIPNNVLPLSKISWNVQGENRKARIAWDIENDSQVETYEIERSRNGNLFSSLTSSSAKQTNGFANYSATDESPYEGWNYYRIKIKGKNGSAVYTDVKKVWFQVTGIQKLYPNPAVDVVNLQLAADPAPGSTLQIVDANGRIVYRSNVLLSNMQVPVQKLVPGNYTLQYITQGTIRSYQFIKMRN
jgi:hypothetical protein